MHSEPANNIENPPEDAIENGVSVNEDEDEGGDESEDKVLKHALQSNLPWAPQFLLWYSVRIAIVAFFVCCADVLFRGSYSAGFSMIIHIPPSAIVFICSIATVIVLMTSKVSNLQPKPDYSTCVKLFGFGLVSGGILAIATIVFDALDFISVAGRFECNGSELEGAESLTNSAVSIALHLLLITTILLSLSSLRQSDTYEKSLHIKPRMEKLEKFIIGFTRVISACCTPTAGNFNTDLMKKSIHTQHKWHHLIQFFYEVILFIVAISNGQYLHLIAICTGLVASGLAVTSSILKSALKSLILIQMETILNIFAVFVSLFVTGIEIVGMKCETSSGDLDDYRYIIYLFMFAVIADSIRLNATLHGIFEVNRGTWTWVCHKLAGKGWKKEVEKHHGDDDDASRVGVHQHHIAAGKPTKTKTKIKKNSITILSTIIGILLLTCLLVGVLWLLPGMNVFNSSMKMSCCVTNATFVKSSCQPLYSSSTDAGQGKELELLVDVKNYTSAVLIKHAVNVKVETCDYWSESDSNQCTDMHVRCYEQDDDIPSSYRVNSCFTCYYSQGQTEAHIYKPWIPVGAIVTLGVVGFLALMLLFAFIFIFRAYRKQQRGNSSSRPLLENIS